MISGSAVVTAAWDAETTRRPIGRADADAGSNSSPPPHRPKGFAEAFGPFELAVHHVQDARIGDERRDAWIPFLLLQRRGQLLALSEALCGSSSQRSASITSSGRSPPPSGYRRGGRPDKARCRRRTSGSSCSGVSCGRPRPAASATELRWAARRPENDGDNGAGDRLEQLALHVLSLRAVAKPPSAPTKPEEALGGLNR